MSSLFWTYFLGSDFEEEFNIQFKEKSIDYVKKEISDTLFPDSIKVLDRDKKIIFRENISPLFGDEYRPVYIVYKIETVISEDKLNTLNTRYYLETTIKVMNFLTTMIIICISLIFALQLTIFSFETLVKFNNYFLFILFASTILKIFINTFIYQEVTQYREKVDRLLLQSLIE